MHEQEHGHSHAHHHDHEHSHEHGGFESLEQAQALMRYMLDHNRHHAEELHEVCHKLEHMEKEAAAGVLGEALEHFRTGNDLLEQALKALEAC